MLKTPLLLVRGGIFTVALLLCVQAVLAAAPKALTLATFEGIWILDVTKSKAGVKEAVAMLAGYEGFKFAISAKNKTMRMEWPGFEPKTHKLTVVEADSAKIKCKLDGFEQIMIIEQSGPDELLIKDRDEALTFNRVKPAPKK